MEAVRLNLQTKKLEYFPNLPIPKIGHPDEVLVKVAYSGVCGTDLHIITGEFPINPLSSSYLTLGHEFSGTVVSFGVNVKNLTAGDLVVVDPNNGCNTCRPCHSGEPHFCPRGGHYANLGVKNDGAWASYCLCSNQQIRKLPTNVSLKDGALAEPLSCLAHGLDMVQPIRVGEKFLIFGAGIIGTLWACILHSAGHRNVTVCERNETRLKLLKKLEFSTFSFVTPDQLMGDTDRCFDVVIDCSGAPSAIELGISSLRSGGKMCLFGVAAHDAKIQLSPFDIYMKELKLFSVKVNPYTFPKAIGLIQAMRDRYLNYEKLGIKEFNLKDYQQAIDELKSGAITKAIFKN